MSALLAICFMQTAFAEVVPNPIPQMEKISNQMLDALKKNEANLSKKPQVVYDIVRKILLPHVDLTIMARSALGRSAWASATESERQAFSQQFELLMLKTYAAGLASYTDESVEFEPLRGGVPLGQTRVEVNSKIIRPDGPSIAVSYRLIYKNQDWFVYDFSVEGVSMIESFRSQFAADISEGMSLSTLIEKLARHDKLVAA